MKKSKKAVIDFKAHKTMFDDVKNKPAFKKGYEKELLAEFAESVRELRSKYGMSQKDVAKKAGTKQQVISRLEQGVDDIKLSTFFRVANVLHMDLDRFIHDVRK